MSRADYISRADVEGGLLIEGGCRGRTTYRGQILLFCVVVHKEGDVYIIIFN
jgi:hypothetical protein